MNALKKKSNYQIALEEISLAYSDAKDGNTSQRNLNFRASVPVSVKDAVKIMTKALSVKSSDERGYNDFYPSLLERLPAKTKVFLAREYSVCVYVQLPAGEKINAKSLKTDGCHIQKDGTIRLWYD